MSKKKKYWFGTKNYGYGWGLPTRWEGWASFLLFAIILVGAMSILALPYLESQIPPSNLVILLCVLALDVFMLVAVSYRYGETPEWRWRGKKIGPRKKSKKSKSKKR